AGLPRLAEGGHAGDANFFHGFAGRFQIVAGVEFLGRAREHLANGGGNRDAAVGIDVDLADAVLDAALNLFDRHAPGLLHVAAVFAQLVLQVLRHRGAAVHDEVAVGKLSVDRDDAVHGEHFAIGFASEFVGAVAGADGDSEGIHARLF